jgi:hypothetical protein
MRIHFSLQYTAVSVVFAFILLFSSTGADAAEHKVPSEFATIQAAISSPTFSSGDAVVVAPGTYFGPITVPNNINLTIRGTETARTFLEGGNSGLPVMTINGTGSTLLSTVNIRNFTFLNASSGISVSNNSISLITVNITNNVFQGLAGAAVTELFSGSTHVVNNTFYQNTTALVCDSDIDISNNIFSGNATAVSDTAPSISRISNNSFFNNSLDVVSGISVTTGTNPVAGDPLFADFVNHDFHLREGSPCIGKGTDGTDSARTAALSRTRSPFPLRD